jgi:hypothetical protein
MRRKRHFAPAPRIRRPAKRAHPPGDVVLVDCSRLLDLVEGVESIAGLPIAAFENDDAASGRAEPRSNNKTRNTPANDAYGAIYGHPRVI